MKTRAAVCILLSLSGAFALRAAPPAGKNWRLVFEDNFDYPNAKLDARWISQNTANGHILSSRWRENVTLEGGLLKLNNKKETRAGQNWTSASIWTRRQFLYGYFECRYRYAAATGVNNSFWLISPNTVPAGQKRYEIDINEGHYPNEINTNLHNWSDITTVGGVSTHPAYWEAFVFNVPPPNPGTSHEYATGVMTRKIRLHAKYAPYFHLRELRVFGPSDIGYPSPYDNYYLLKFPNLANYALSATLENYSGQYTADALYNPSRAFDGSLNTSWVTQTAGEKFIDIDLGAERDVRCIQTFTGWSSAGEWVKHTNDYELFYWSQAEAKWKAFPQSGNSHQLYKTISARKIRLRTSYGAHFHIREFKIFPPNSDSYPSVYYDAYSPKFPSLSNLSIGAQVSVSGTYSAQDIHKAANAIDGSDSTSWVSQADGEKIYEITLPQKSEIGCVQVSTGWTSGGTLVNYISDYDLEYFDEDAREWAVFAGRSSQAMNPRNNYSADFHTYALEWNADELVYYFDGKAIRRRTNDIAHSASPVYLSAAIAEFAGEVTDTIDGTSMDVDWVRIYEIDDGSGKKSYSAWAKEENLEGESALADAKNYGATNLELYAFALAEGQTASEGGNFRLSRTGSSLKFEYRTPSYIENTALTFEISRDLKTWSAPLWSVQKEYSQGGFDYFSAAAAGVSGNGPVFLRVKVTDPNL